MIFSRTGCLQTSGPCKPSEYGPFEFEGKVKALLFKSFYVHGRSELSGSCYSTSVEVTTIRIYGI